MSSVTENGDVTAGKPNEEKTYKKVNKTYFSLHVFSLYIGNSSLPSVKYISELTKYKNKKIMFCGFLKIHYSFCEIIRHF